MLVQLDGDADIKLFSGQVKTPLLMIRMNETLTQWLES